MSRGWPQIRLRLPPEVDLAIEAGAKKSRRTKNAETVFLLERALEAREANDGAQIGVRGPVVGEHHNSVDALSD